MLADVLYTIKIVFSFWTNYEMFPFACFFRFRFIMYLVLPLLKVALVNFTLNEYMMMMNGLARSFFNRSGFVLVQIARDAAGAFGNYAETKIE